MHVQTSHAYTPPVTPVTRPAADDAQKATPTANAPTKTEPSTNNAVTGTTGSNLSAETTAALLESTQQASTAKPETTLPIGVQHGLDDIANDPGYATQRAHEQGTLNELVAIRAEDMPKNGDPASVWMAFAHKMDAMQADLEVARQQRSTFYDSKVAENLPPAQIYADLLMFKANQSEHNARIDAIQGNPEGTRAASLLAQHDYLQTAIATANATEATG